MNIGINRKWFVFTAGVITGVLPSFGAFTAWVWAGPDSMNDYYVSSAVHAAAPESSYVPAIIVAVVAITVIAAVAVVRFVKMKHH